MKFIFILWAAIFTKKSGAVDSDPSDTSICGGFVVSDSPIDYSKIEVNLLDSNGNLKYQAPCSTTNGNYEVPVFGKKGEFILAVSAPPSYSFEPARVTVNINGVDDPCTTQKNINFKFTGYKLLGKVQSKKSSDGPAGVTLQVFQSGDSNTPVATTSTGEGGSFSVPNLLPGSYKVRVSHTDFSFEKAEISVNVKDDTSRIPDGSLVVNGYTVRGRVQSLKEPVPDVIFVLYSSNVDQKDLSLCDKSIVHDLPQENPKHGKQVCAARSDKDGVFTFRSLPTGSYTVVPTHKGAVRYNIEPSHLLFEVAHKALDIPEVFEVKGFSVHGTVRISASGSGVPSADVYLNDTLVAKTTSSGRYNLDKVTTGWYKIDVKKDSFDFPSTFLKITPTDAALPPIIVRSFSVCGEIKTTRPIDRVLSFDAVEVNTGIPRDTVIRDGKFCTFLETGQYKVSVFDAPSKDHQQLIFSPGEQIIKVVDQPITNLVFTQVLGQIVGTVKCIGQCPQDLRVSLLGPNGEQYATVSSKGEFGFQNVDLGSHTVELVDPTRKYCWDLMKKTVEIGAKKPTAAAVFQQTGFLLEVWSTHRDEIIYQLPGKTEKRDTKIKQGFTETCVPDAGVYQISAKGCHKYEQDSYQFDTSAPSRVTLQAVAHLVNISVNLDDVSAQFSLQTRKATDGSFATLNPAGKPNKISDGVFQFSFLDYHLPNELLSIAPVSDILLFKPKSLELVVSDNCPENVALFEAFKGVMIAGAVEPAVADVSIVVETTEGVLEAVTDQKGSYSLGPVSRNAVKSVKAEKRGYDLELQPGTHNFKATKLSEIRVVTRDATGVPVSNVLVSISNNAGFRTNSLTDSSGVVSFVNVAPGEFLVRPMMKEFRFDPASKSVSLSQGKVAEVEWTGIRIAYSAFGQVRTIAGEPEAGVPVEAISMEPCPQMQEEGKTGTDGVFRISGLKSGCEYVVRAKPVELKETGIKFTAPSNRTIAMSNEDFRGLDLIAVRGFDECEITGYLDTAKEHLSTVKVCLYRSERMSDALQCVSFNINPMFNFEKVPLDNKQYVIRMESSLSRKDFVYVTPDIAVKANETFVHKRISFKVDRKHLEPEITPGNIWVIPLIVVGSVIYMCWESVGPVFKAAIAQLQAKLTKAPVVKTKGRVTTASYSPERSDAGSFESSGTKRKTKAGK